MLSGYDSTTAIVAREPVHGHVNWKLENVSLREIKADELLIRLIATGICHTDLSFSTLPPEVSHYPKILGHEGAGYVQRTGSSVKGIKVGDPVLLSFAFCSSCRDCSEEHVSYCQQSATINHGEQNVFLPTEGPPASGLFFGQSSFSNLAIVKETSAINISGLVRNDEEMKLFAPLGCSVQTGMGTVKELARAGKNDLVLILGLGGVGLAAIMAAKMNDCLCIIGVDKYSSRLDLARSLGATHVINTSDSTIDLGQEVKRITDGSGSTITIDTTGNMGLIEKAMNFTANRGQMIILGVPPLNSQLHVHLFSFMQTGKTLRGSMEGDVVPSKFIPQMIQWYRQGKLPIEKLVRQYQVKDFELALSEMKSGFAIKPVLVWPQHSLGQHGRQSVDGQKVKPCTVTSKF